MSTNIKDYGLLAGDHTHAEVIKIDLTIMKSPFITEYCKMIINELRRIAPNEFENCDLTVDELEKYCFFLIDQRVKCVHGVCNIWRQLKLLSIPMWIETVMSSIGRFFDRRLGLEFMPTVSEDFCDSKYDYQSARDTSEKLLYFDNFLSQRKDAMPRGDEGDCDVMSTVLVANYVYSTRELEAKDAEYVTAFLNLKLNEDFAHTVLYRHRYDDVTYLLNGIRTRALVKR